MSQVYMAKPIVCEKIVTEDYLLLSSGGSW